MKVLRGTSPRALSVCLTNEIGNVIPTFSVLSTTVVPTILVMYIVPLSYKLFELSMYPMNLVL